MLPGHVIPKVILMYIFERMLAAMRLASLMLVCVLAFAADRVCADEGKDRESDRRAIHGVLAAQQEAWNRGDVDAFMAGTGVRRS
jgi:hypothetical protein